MEGAMFSNTGCFLIQLNGVKKKNLKAKIHIEINYRCAERIARKSYLRSTKSYTSFCSVKNYFYLKTLISNTLYVLECY